jgi:hypothetical protein
MITIIESLPEDILGATITGKLKKEDYDALTPKLDEQKKKFGDLKLFMEYDEFEWPTTDAIKEDLKTMFKYDIDKVALVSKTEWLRDAANSAGEFIPTKMKAKGFKPEEHDQAINWLHSVN